MKGTVTLVLSALAAVLLTACGSADKKQQPPAYFSAKPGKPLAAIAPKGIKLPDLSGALVIPAVEQPLGAYNPDLLQPPTVVEGLAVEAEAEQ